MGGTDGVCPGFRILIWSKGDTWLQHTPEPSTFTLQIGEKEYLLKGQVWTLIMSTMALKPGNHAVEPGAERGFAAVQGVYPNPLCPDLPVFDLETFLENPQGCHSLCEAVASCLRSASALVVRDPRIDQAASDTFLDMMEEYFNQSKEEKMADVHPELAYQVESWRWFCVVVNNRLASHLLLGPCSWTQLSAQCKSHCVNHHALNEQVGATPDHVERPRCLAEPALLSDVGGSDTDLPTRPLGADAKWRFFWRVGPRPDTTAYAELNAEPVIPRAFAGRWEPAMDTWGQGLVRTAESVAEIAARGWGLEPDAFVKRLHLGPHLLAPTGIEIGTSPKVGSVFAGFHTDLNFLTVHGAARYPGLFIWLRNGRRIAVRIPRGCILLQAGTQLEYLTGGAVRAGYHEVVCVPEALEAAERAKFAGRPPWRVSSTVFAHLASDTVLQPLGAFDTPESRLRYPPIPTGKKVQQDLAVINLASST